MLGSPSDEPASAQSIRLFSHMKGDFKFEQSTKKTLVSRKKSSFNVVSSPLVCTGFCVGQQIMMPVSRSRRPRSPASPPASHHACPCHHWPVASRGELSISATLAYGGCSESPRSSRGVPLAQWASDPPGRVVLRALEPSHAQPTLSCHPTHTLAFCVATHDHCDSLADYMYSGGRSDAEQGLLLGRVLRRVHLPGYERARQSDRAPAHGRPTSNKAPAAAESRGRAACRSGRLRGQDASCDGLGASPAAQTRLSGAPALPSTSSPARGLPAITARLRRLAGALMTHALNTCPHWWTPWASLGLIG